MSYANFVPTVWNTAINKDLERLCVFAEDCNREYEGEVKGKGESVKILGVGKPTIKSLAKKSRNSDIDGAEEIEDTSIIMPINQIRYFNYKVGDIDKRQSVGGLMDALNSETSEGLASEIDNYIAGLAKESEAVKAFDAAPIITKDNVMEKFDEVIKGLYKNDVKESSKIVATVDPDYYFLLKRAYSELDTSNSGLLKNGKVGMYGKVIVKMSNNVAKNAAGESLIMVRTQRAFAFAKPMTHTEAYRPEKGFADAVKGFILFDAKIVRPKEMLVMNVKYTA